MSVSDWLDRVRGVARRARKRPRTERSLREAYARYTAANREWLSALRDLTIEMGRHLDAATRLRFSLQLAYLDRRDARFRHLLDHAPERLNAAGSLSEFVNSVDTGWSDEDEALLARLHPEYHELCAMIARVKVKAEEEVDGFKGHLDAVSQTERSTVLLNAFRRQVERTEREVWSA